MRILAEDSAQALKTTYVQAGYLPRAGDRLGQRK
ncbi:MAG: hypothetical protein QOE54_5674 [Streptosporangiaceae bacterium]|jgi:hypothetical protein|nr:hypothetical protein [Streptosporangiaceae bacterium]MDX6433308.1 hypothetical protein [Streptosporangiaceae bacterium]